MLVPSDSLAKKKRSPASVVRTYFNAYNKRDGKTMCRNFTPDLRNWFEQRVARLFTGQKYPCRKAAVGMIGYVEDAGFPEFKSVKVLSTKTHIHGSTAVVDVRARYRYKDPDGRPIGTDKIYLFKKRGRWLIAKPGAVYFLSQSASNAPPSIVDPPIPDKGSHKPAPQPSAHFTCDTTLLGNKGDPANTPKSIDIRRVWVSSNSDGGYCLGFEFAARPRPGTELDLDISVDAESGGGLGSSPGIRIGKGGKIYGFAGGDALGERAQAGWSNGQLVFRLPAWEGAAHVQHIEVEATTSSFQFWEPEIKHPMSARVSDRFWEEFGHADSN
jgi:hypothetical protein